MCGFFFSRNDMKVDLDDLLQKMIHRGPDSTKKISFKNCHDFKVIFSQILYYL